MNKVFLIGRLTKKPEVRYNSNNTAISNFTLAVDRKTDKEGNRETDFISCKCFNNLAVNLVKYQGKGNLLAISGRIQTGSYEKEGNKVYTTDVLVDEIQFLTFKNSQEGGTQTQSDTQTEHNSATSAESDLSKYQQLSTTTVMNEDYNPELQISDEDLPF